MTASGLKRKRKKKRHISGYKNNEHENRIVDGWLKSCSTYTETVGLLGTGAQDVHLDFHTAPEL